MWGSPEEVLKQVAQGSGVVLCAQRHHNHCTPGGSQLQFRLSVDRGGNLPPG